MPQALPGSAVSTPPSGVTSGVGVGSRSGGLLRVVSGAQLDDADRARTDQLRAQSQARLPAQDLGYYIRERWNVFRNHRNQGNAPINNRLLKAQRMFDGQYDASKLAEIQKFGGSTVYSRTVATKCRGATSLLRDVYLGPDRPWDIQSQPDPEVPPEIQANIMQLVSSEVQTVRAAGGAMLPEQAHMRTVALMRAATTAARRNAAAQAKATTDKVEDILVTGRFYEALTEFLIDLPLFPFACLKGPVVRMVPKLDWDAEGVPSFRTTPQMFWERVSPFDISWSPGVGRIEDADIIERKRLTRGDLSDLIGLPGYDEKAIRAALVDYGMGLRDWLDAPDTEQALAEGRENPTLNQSHMIDALEFHGSIQGSVLLAQGVPKSQIPDPDRDYQVQSWVVGRHTIKTQLNPSPRQRHPYYLTSYQKVPGTVAGHALPDMLEDIEEVANAAQRAMVNNMAISSGPQVVVNDEMLAPTENGDDLYPWKRWHLSGDPMGSTREPISFFQPQSNAQELMAIYQQAMTSADEVSGIPKYMTGNSLSGGAGRTASGLSMLTANAEKVLGTVASNVDQDVMNPLLQGLYDMIMLTDRSGLLTGEEEIRVRGVNVATQRETERQKQLQFLQITANPIDAPIIGMVGRARVLRPVAQGLGLPDDIVPDDQTLQQQEDAQKQLQAAQTALAAHGTQLGHPPGSPHNPAPEGAAGPAKPGGAASPPGQKPPTAQAAGAANQAPAPTSTPSPGLNLQQGVKGIPT